MTKTFQNFIAGAWSAPASGAYFENRNPADTRELIGRFPLSNAADVDRAVASAQRGFAIWSRTPAPARRRSARAAEGGDRGSDDARDGQAAHRDARRRAGGDRYRLLRGDDGTAASRP